MIQDKHYLYEKEERVITVDIKCTSRLFVMFGKTPNFDMNQTIKINIVTFIIIFCRKNNQ